MSLPWVLQTSHSLKIFSIGCHDISINYDARLCWSLTMYGTDPDRDSIVIGKMYMLILFEYRLELWPETILELSKLYIFVNLVFPRARDLYCLLLVYDTTLIMSRKWVSSPLNLVYDEFAFFPIATWPWNIFLVGQIYLVSITQRCWSVGQRTDSKIVKSLFASWLSKKKVRRFNSLRKSLSLAEWIQLFWDWIVKLWAVHCYVLLWTDDR